MTERTTPRKRLPQGRGVIHYRYVTADGTPVGVVVSTPKSAAYWLATDEGWVAAAPPRPHPLYLLPDLDRPGVVVVTPNERSAEAVRRHWPDRAVTTWVGGRARIADTDWKPLAKRDVSIIAAGSTEGHTEAKDLADVLAGLGCAVKMMLPATDGTDIADWLDTDPDEAREKIRLGLKPATGQAAEPEPVPDIAEQIREVGAEVFDELAAADEAELRMNRYYRLLGVRGGTVHVQHVRSGDVAAYRRASLCEKKTLIALAPETFWLRHTGGAFGPQQAVQMGDSLIRAADRLGPFNPTAVLGRGAARMEDGAVLWHLGDRLLRPDGTTTETLEYGSQLFIADAPIALTDPASDAVMREVAEAVLAYRWLAEEDGRRFLGWIAASLAAGALEWRPHIALIAPASTGKTWLLSNVVERILGPAGHVLVDTTEAALARGTGSEALPVILDEAEPDTLQLVLRTLRAAAGGAGMRWRASMNGQGIDVQRSRFCAMVTATATPRLGRADESRLSPVSFGAGVTSAEFTRIAERIGKALGGHGPAVRSRIIRDTPIIVEHAESLTTHFRSKGEDSREAAASGALTAGWHEWCADEVKVSARVASADLGDAAEALREILELTTHVAGVGERSLWRLLSGGKDAQATAADVFGVKRYQGGTGLVLAYRHSGLIRALRGSRWANYDLLKLLEQMPSMGHRCQVRMSGRKQWCLWIPPDALDSLGFAFATEEGQAPEF